MAGNAAPEPTPQLGWKATVAGFVFALAVLGGFGAATAIATSGDDGHGDDQGEVHSENSDDDHVDEVEEHPDEG